MAATIGLERKRLEKRLLFLGAVGNNAPFVGLLGTVIGIVGAFEELGKPQSMTGAMATAGSLAPERVMGTIAEALVATAVGLIVAIPAVAVWADGTTQVNGVPSRSDRELLDRAKASLSSHPELRAVLQARASRAE